MDIYDRINEHKMMNNDDLKNIINYRLKKLNLYKKKINVIFSNEKDLYFKYHELMNEIIVSNNYKKLTLKPIIEDECIKVVKKKELCKNTFLNDFYNLQLLICPFHEVRHAEQYHKMLDKKFDYNILINKSWNYVDNNRTFYYSNHPRFLIEHDANLNAKMIILNDIEEGNLNVCLNSIYLFNIYTAYFLLRSRGFVIKDKKLQRKSIFKSPLHLLYFYNKSLYLKKEIDEDEFNSINHSIKKIRMNNKTEYDRIISGDSLSDETINDLYLIASGKMKTENIFMHFENKELEKNNNHFVKKLILSKE